MTQFDEICFHEADITRLELVDGTLILDVQGAHVGEAAISVQVSFLKVTDVVADGLPVSAVQIESSDGEVLTLARNNQAVTLILEWHSYSPHRWTTRSYRFNSAEVRFTVGD